MSEKDAKFPTNLHLSFAHYFIPQSLNSGSVQAQIRLTACQRFVMMKISDNGHSSK